MAGAVFIGPLFPYTPSHWSVMLSSWLGSGFQQRLPVYRWWTRMNANHWHEDYPEFAEWFISRCFSEPHSTKGVEDGVEWALDTDGDTLIATGGGDIHTGRRTLRKLARGLDCPVLVVQGTRDKITPPRDGKALARLSGGELEIVERAGHFPQARKPVQVNLAMRDFAEDAFGLPRTPRDPTAYRPDGRPRALYISSPIGLGHAQRDVAIARELRRLQPDLEIDWLAQDPVTRVLEGEGERIHPASKHLASESKHIESESAEHDLHCFQALRRMDEILAANFMLFHDVVPRRALRPVDRRRGLGARLLPPREPAREARPVRLADRLRRLPPDGGRRQARGLRDRRLQRRHGRSHRRPPRGPRPRALRRQPRRHRR